MNDNKRKLYDALSQEYDLGTFEQFESDIADAGKRRRLYDATINDYDFGDYDSFSSQLGFVQQAQEVAPQQDVLQTQTEMAAPVRQPMPESEYLGKITLETPNTPVEGDIYRGEYGTYTRTEVPYKTKEYASLEDAKAGRELNIEVSDEEALARMRKDGESRAAERYTQLMQGMKTGEQQEYSMQGALNRAYGAAKGVYYADEAERLTKGLFDEYSAERAKRLSQVEKDVENYNSARRWAVSNPYATDAYSEVAYRSNAMKLRNADELGMMEEFAKDAKKRLLADENLKAKAEENAELLGIPVERYINEVAVPIMQEMMYSEWLAPQEERAKRNYNGLAAAAEGSLIGTLLGATRTDTEKYLSQVGQEAWRKNASLLGRAAAGAGSMFLDLPAFVGIGELASVPAKAVGGQMFKQLAKNETKRLVARGVAEGAAQRYANYAVRNGLKNRILLNLSTAPLQSGLTFGMFDAGKAALNMSLNDEWSWKELGKSAAGGTLLGGALGVTGAVGSGLTHGLSGVAKVGAKVAEFGVENAVFTEGGRLIGKLHGQQPENGWLEDYVESGATLLMIKAPNIAKNVSRIKGDKEASEVFAFNSLEREQLGKYGEDLNAVLESLLPKSARVYEDGLKINEGTFTEEYRRVMSDPDVAITTKAKLMGIVEGKVMPAPRVVDAQIEGNRVMTYDPMGRLVEVKEYATEAKANAEYKKVANAAEIESIAVMEDMYVRIKGYEADDVTVREWLAKNPTVTAEDIANIIAKNSAGEKLTEGEQRILESLRKARREGLNDVRHLNDVLAELDVDPKDVMSGIEKPIDERTEAENRAVKAYTDVLYQEINAKVVEPFRRGEARRAEDIDTTVRLIESDRSVDETANDGMVYTTTTPSGEKIIITGGKVVLDGEGYIDVNQSEGLVAMFPDGQKKPVRPGDLREKVEVSNAEEMKAVKREEIEQEIAAENGWKPIEVGAEYDVVFDGDAFRVKVEGRDENGDVIISGEGASMAVPESFLQDAMKQAEAVGEMPIATEPVVAPVESTVPTAEEVADAQAFADAYAANTMEAYQNYLDKFPEGAYRDGARNGIWTLEGTDVADVSSITNARDVLERAVANEVQPEVAPVVEGQKGENVVESSPTGEAATPVVEAPKTALEQIPRNENNVPLYEQVDSELAWDGVVEEAGGNEETAMVAVNSMVEDKKKALAAAEKAKAKAGATITEKIAAENERVANIEKAKADLAKWEEIAGVKAKRALAAEAEKKILADEAAAKLRAEEERLRAEREAAERVEREALNGVPDMVDDKPQEARVRGYRRVNGHKVDRQEPVQGLMGKEIAVKFSDSSIPTGRVAVIEAEQLQPSHIQGQRNPLHFIDEAQPKERNDAASVLSARKIAENVRPEEITSSVTAYTGAPTVNARGEAVQGNNRSAALRLMWENNPEQAAKYKQYLMDHAAEFGLNAEEIAAMKSPVLVNMLDVSDADAITLGQYVAQDTESGGTERIKPKNVMQKMGGDMRSFANKLLASNNEEASFAELVDANGVEVLKWMAQKGYITPTQYKSAFDSKGNLTAEVKNDLRDVMYQSIFKGGSTLLEEMFNALPAKAQKAILATAFRDYDSPSGERMNGEVQNSIRAYYALARDAAFANAKNYKEAKEAAMMWARQYQLDDVSGESFLPSENFSNFAIELAVRYKGETQKTLQNLFNNMYDLIQGTKEALLFEEVDNTPRSLKDAIKETLNIDYNGQPNSNALAGDDKAGQPGRQGTAGSAATGERIEGGERPADSTGGTRGNGEVSSPEIPNSSTGEVVSPVEANAEGGNAPGQSGVAATLIKGAKWENTGEPDKIKFSRKKGDSHDITWYIGKKKYGSTTAERDLLVILAEDYGGDLNAVWNAYEQGEVLLSVNEAAILKKLIETNTSVAELQQGVLELDRENPAFERATKITMDAVERLKANGLDIEVVSQEETDAMMELAEMQKRTAPETVSVQDEHLQTVVSSAGKRKSPETALPEDESSFKGTAISSDDGAKILKDIDSAIVKYENSNDRAETFIGNVAKALGIDAKDKSSKYATFEAKNGVIFTIRISNHNATVSNFDNAGEGNGISIVISRKPNEGVTNDGNAHLVEFFYPEKKISKADGKPLVEILKSIKQALYSGEYKDNTGLAVREEVNIPEMMTVFHGSGAKFDKFDHSYMGTGEGAQAFGWGTYVTEVEGIGRTYAESTSGNIFKSGFGDFYLKKIREGLAEGKSFEEIKQNLLEFHAHLYEQVDGNTEMYGDFISDYEKLQSLKEEDLPKRNLYSVETPDDNGSNYLHWEERINGEIQERIANGLQSIGFEIEPDMNHLAYSRDEKIVVLNINAKGEDLYAELSEALGGDKAASLFLNNFGFVGISYPANATTGGRADGARNYVIFNENDAQIKDRVEFLRAAGGKVYGWAVDGKIRLTPDGVNPNTPVHEYAHLWGADVEKNNPKLWNEVVEAMKLSPVWNEVANDVNYSNIHGNDSRMASEVLARLSGRENYRRTMEEAEKEIAAERDIVGKVQKKGILNRIKNALKNFWNWVQRNVFKRGERSNVKAESESADVMPWEEFANSVIGDFYKGKNPNVKESTLERMFMGEKGAENLDKAEEATTRLDNLNVAREMETVGKDAKAIKLATGWERGADGKWKYETEDVKLDRAAELFSLENHQSYPIAESLDKGRVDFNGTIKLTDLVNDEELFKAYPGMEEYYVSFEEMSANVKGEHDAANTMIRINKDDISELESTLVHEIQHAIQSAEGFAKGGSTSSSNGLIQEVLKTLHVDSNYPPSLSEVISAVENGYITRSQHEELVKIAQSHGYDDAVEYVRSLSPYSYYRRLAGEVESRNVQERMGMTPEERRNKLAEETEDVRREDQIFLEKNLGVSANEEVKKESAEKSAVKNNANFVSTYKTKDGKDIEYTSERAEGYGIQGGGTGNSYDGTGNSILQRQTDTGIPGANSGLNKDKGEFCIVERVFTENGAFNFTSGEKIESADDVAYIFSALEDAAKEHSFVVYVKDGKPTVIELGMGSFNATMVDVPTASLAYSRINPDHVYFVHNHPSGNLVCSDQDVAMLRVFEDMSDVPVTGVIINLKTGKYGTFDTERHSVIGEKRVPEKEERLTVHTLDKQIFAPDYDPMAQPLVRSSQDVAQFLNSQRMGDRPKVSFLILSRANRIIGNIHTPFTNITTDVEAVARYINERVIQFGGENAILYGDFAISMDESRGFRLLQGAMERFGKTKLLDVVHVEGNFTKSAIDLGLLYEPEMEYNVAKENGEKYDSPEQDISVESVQTQPLTFAEKITNSVLGASAKNRENFALRSDALRMFGRDVANVLKLMGKQREYDKSTVDQLVKLAKMYFKDAQLLGGLTPYQVGRVMTRLNNAVGKRDITDDANELVNILVDAHNKELEKMLEKQAKTKAKKVNASGVEVIGKLDKEGQLLLEEYNTGKELDLERIDEKILDLQNEAADANGNVEGESGEPDAERTREVAARLRGLELARQYREEILAKKDEIKGLEQELKSAEQDAKDGAMDRAAYKEFRRATERAILESKLEMVDAYHGLIHGLGGDISSSAKRAKLFQQQQIDHVKEIQNNANSDLLGHPAEAQGETPDKWNSSVPRLFMSAMPTFQTMLKFFGEKAPDGRGYLYERFIPQHTQASHNEYVGKTEAREKMRKKLTEIFGKKTSIEDFLDMSRKDGAVLEYQEGGQKKTIDLTRGQVLYLYMINKMADGQMKLSRMGITDADVLKMAKELPEEMVRFADWVQEEFLTELREKYNKVHERMFGAPMAAIESYFPIKINKRSRGEKIEPGMNAEDKPSTVTGSVIKRTKNAVAIDLSADAMQVLLGHIDDMENWAAWAEFRRDVKSLLNYRHFQNQVKGMESLRYGSGEKLWKNFVDVANIAAGSFKPSSTAADRAVRNIAKGVVSSKIAFRYFTAVKQILSAPAFWSEVDFDKMVHAYTHQREAWKWAKENLPGFTKRWEGRAAGNEILLESDADWKVWQNRMIEWLSKEGMRANAAIDALTVAVGAKAVFETKYEMFKKAGYSEERAREKALNRAAEAYNESQQSSESAYLSPLQAEATFVSSVLTAYRNSPFGYNRKMATAIANLKKKMKKGFKQESIEYMTKQLMRDGLNEEQAKKFAKSTYRRSVARDAADVALYEFFLNYIWVLGPSLIYIFGGDDDEKKKELNVEALIDGAMGGLGNLPAGETLTGAIKAIAEGDVSNFKLPQAVAMQDMETIADLMQTDPVRAAGEVLNILVAMGVGVNPQTFTDMFVALADTEDWSDPRELAMLVLRLINAPNSKLELLEADEAMENYGANIEEITREYAEYQKSKRAPLTRLMYSDDSEQKAIERYEKRFKKILDERFESIVENTAEYDMWYENSDPQMKAKLAKLRKAYLGGDKETTMEKLDSIDVTKKVLFGSGYDEVNTVYYELSTAEDEDMALMIDTKLKELTPMMDEYNKLRGDEHKAYREENLGKIQFYNRLNGHKNNVNTLKGIMKKNPDKAQEKLERIRKIRTKAIDLINNYNE